MATARFIHDGHSIDYTPDADVSAGDVIVQSELVGVAKLDIAAGQFGALAVVGVFDFPKETGPSTAIAAGTKVYWAPGGDYVFTNGMFPNLRFLGHTVAAATDDDATVRVRLCASDHTIPA